MSPKNTQIEINLFYQNFRDSQQFLKLCKSEKSKLKSFYSRHSILSSVYASEALINKIYDKFYLGKIDSKISNSVERIPTAEKWILAPLVCGVENPPGKTFNRGEEPFQSFKEIIKIRDSLVHPKPGIFVEAEEDGKISWQSGPEDVPFFKIKPGVDYWAHTKIPKNPFEMNEIHAEKSISTITEMIKILIEFFEGVFDEKWLFECAYRSEGDADFQNIHIDWIWGGLTPG